MLSLHKDPEGNTVFSAHEEASANAAAHINSTIQGGIQTQICDLQEENKDLKKKVKQLEETIIAYQVQLDYS